MKKAYVVDSNQPRQRVHSSMVVENEKGEFELSPCFRFIYLFLIVSIVSGIAAWQGLLTKNSESTMISVQAENQCNQIFDVVERGWEEIQSFAQTIAAGMIAHNLDESVDKWLVLRETDIVQSMKSRALRVNWFCLSLCGFACLYFDNRLYVFSLILHTI